MPDFVNDNLSGAQFETSVRQVSRQLYRHVISSGPVKIDNRERDDVIDTGTELIIVEATQSRKLLKTEYDLNKSIDLVKLLKSDAKYQDHNFRIMLVTAEDPTADQVGFVRGAKAGCPKEIISFSTLFSRLFDARHYIRLRGDYAFGSVRDPANENNYKIPQSDYIPTALNLESSGEAFKAASVAEKINDGGHFVIFGDYGSGKSMTLRDIYFRARDRFIAGHTNRCPVYLNLREHIAQTQPDEALYRHAEKIGFSEPHSLISAWRAGFVILFLDGFDELTPPQFTSSVYNLRQARRFAVEIVSKFFEQTPVGAPIIIAGRESYFDRRDEAQIALGYGNDASVFDLAGFNDREIERFLKAKEGQLPTWLPTRPLLLGYLANAGLLSLHGNGVALDPATGWDAMLQRVCEREVKQIWGVGFEAGDLRLFIEGLATQARKSRDGRGLEDSGLRNVFRAVFGRDTDEPANLLTLRLPGLGSIPGRPGAREFIDADFADAAASGDLTRYVEAPFVNGVMLHGVSAPLADLGRQMVVLRLKDVPAQISLAVHQCSQAPEMATTATDLLQILIDREANYQGSFVTIQDANLEIVRVDPEINMSEINFLRCIINTVELSRSSIDKDKKNSPHFHDCIIDSLEGAISSNDVADGVLTGSTSVEKYVAFAATNGAVMKSKLADPMKVLLTILRKLFMQRGAGRQYSALRRGLPPELVKYVDPIIAQVKAKGFAEDVDLDRRTILIPNRSRSADALSIINGPNTSTDPLVESVKTL